MPTVRAGPDAPRIPAAMAEVKAVPTGKAVSTSLATAPPPPASNGTIAVSNAPVEAASAMNRYRTRQSGPTPAHLVAMGLIVFLVVGCFIGVYFAIQNISGKDVTTPEPPKENTPRKTRPINRRLFAEMPDTRKPEKPATKYRKARLHHRRNIPTSDEPIHGTDEHERIRPATLPASEFGPQGDPLNDPDLPHATR